MRKGGLLLAALLGAAAIVGLLLALREPDGARHRAASDATTDPDARRLAPDAATSDGAAPAPLLDVEDRDPNRIPGPDVTVRGTVRFERAPAAGAIVRIHRAHPRILKWSAWTADPDETERARAAVAETRCGPDGRFAVSFARRSELVVEAAFPGAAVTRVVLLVPDVGDPDEVTIVLGRGEVVRGRVVDEKDEPVAGARVRWTASTWQVPPVVRDTTTDAEGRFALEGLGRAWITVQVDAEGYPRASRTLTVPMAGTLRIVLLPGGSVRGKVTRPDGTVVPEARVTLSVTTVDGNAGGASARTGPDGVYAIERIAAGAVEGVSIQVGAGPTLTVSYRDLAMPRASVRSGEELVLDLVVPPVAEVRGVVVAAEGGEPIPHAEVRLLRLANQSMNEYAGARSDDAGRFAIAGVPPGVYAFDVEAPGFARHAVRWAQGAEPITIDLELEPGVEPPGQRIAVGAAGAVRGVVRGVYAARDSSTYSGINLVSGRRWLSTTMDCLGRFRFDAVPATTGATVQTWDARAKSKPFDVVAGKTTEVTLDVGEGVAFEGTVFGPDGRPVAGAFVRLLQPHALSTESIQPLDQVAWNAARSDEDGRYALAPPEWLRSNAQGGMVLLAQHPDHGAAIQRDVALPPEGERRALDLRLEQADVVAGVARYEDGSPATGALVTLQPKVASARAPGAAPPLHGGRTATTTAGEDGRFEFRGVHPGEYTIVATTSGGKSDTLTTPSNSPNLALVLRRTESIAGLVVDEGGRPVPGVQVAALSGDPKRPIVSSTTTTQSGRFVIRHLDRGAYPLQAAPDPQQQQWGGRAFNFPPKRIDPVATGREDAEIVVTLGGRIEGRVVSASGKPVPAATVLALPLAIVAGSGQPWQEARPNARANTKGEFTLEGAGSDEVELVAFAPGHVFSRRRARAGDSKVEIVLRAGESIEGVVLRPDGSPAGGAWIQIHPLSREVQEELQAIQQRAGQWAYMGGGVTQPTVSTDASGRFRSGALLPGEYRASVRLDDAVLPPTVLRAGERGVTLRLVTPLTVAGVVVDEEGKPLVSDPARQLWVGVNAFVAGAWYAGSSTKSDGSFEIGGVPAGRVELQAWAGGYEPLRLEVEAGARDLRLVMRKPRPKEPKPN